jgi:hypothetical protein
MIEKNYLKLILNYVSKNHKKLPLHITQNYKDDVVRYFDNLLNTAEPLNLLEIKLEKERLNIEKDIEEIKEKRKIKSKLINKEKKRQRGKRGEGKNSKKYIKNKKYKKYKKEKSSKKVVN